MLTRKHLLLLACALLVLVSPVINAQQGSLWVTVTDTETRAVENATVRLESRDGQIVEATTDELGLASFEEIDSGFYRVTVLKDGFASVTQPSARIDRNKTTPVNINLVEVRDDALEEVVVQANAMRTSIAGPVSTTFIDREQLRTAPGSGGDVFRSLDGLPGLFSTGEFSNYTVRGLGPRDNLILVDDFPYKSVTHFDESLGEREELKGGGRYSIFSPNFVESAEYAPGGWSAGYGGKNASLLRMTVPRGNPSPYASFRLDYAGVEVFYDGPGGFHRDTSIIATARKYDFGRFFDLIGEEDIGEAELTDINVKTHTVLNDDNELEFLFLYNPESSSRDVENVLASDNLQDRELLDTDQDALLIGSKWKHLFSDAVVWENRLFYRLWDKTSSEGEAFPYSDPEALPPEEVPVRENILNLREEENEFGWRSDLFVTNRMGQLRAGLRISSLDLRYQSELDGDWIRYEFNSDDYRPDPEQKFIVLTPEQSDAYYDENALVYAGYLEQSFDFSSGSITTGLRYDHDGFTGESYVSPRLIADYSISSDTRFSATAGTFYQAPRVVDRAANAANADLEWEKMQHVSIGVQHLVNDRWSILAEAYFRKLDDLITEKDGVTGETGNFGEGDSWGLDVVVNRYFANGWSANLAYSYNDTKLNDNDGAGDYPSDNNQEHLVSIGAQWEINEYWQIGMRWKYSSGVPIDEFVIHDDVLAELGGPLRYSREFVTNNTDRGDSFYTLNLRVDYRVPLGSVDFVAFLDVINVTGSSTSEEPEFDPATGLLYEDSEEALPLIGLIIEKSW